MTTPHRSPQQRSRRAILSRRPVPPGALQPAEKNPSTGGDVPALVEADPTPDNEERNMNADQWERRIIAAGVLSTGTLGGAGAVVAMWGGLLGYPVIAWDGIVAMGLAVCVGAAGVIAARIAGNRVNTRNGEEC